MIVYKEFSSLARDLGFSAKTLYSVSNHIGRHFKEVDIPKKNGEFRRLHVPDVLLKSIQRRINERLLVLEEISPYATAYRCGGSVKNNARAHVGKPVVLKLDIRHFFDGLIYPTVKEKAFPAERYSEQNRVLLALLCVYKDALAQGAPTSPAISNIIMREFDNEIGGWCAERGITYTRYCDDMTFSGDFEPKAVVEKVSCGLNKLGLYLNGKKTVVARRGQKQAVTGIVVNEKTSVDAEYKKRLRQEMYYCMKFGVRSHLNAIKVDEAPRQYVMRLLGRVNYVLSVEPRNEKMKAYKMWLQEQMKQYV